MAWADDRGASELPFNWKWMVGIGVVLAILGLVALVNALDATLVTTIIVGWVLVAAGAMQLVGAFTGSSSTGWRILQGLLGVLYIVVGFNIAFDPLAGAIALTVAIGLMLLIDGFARIIMAFVERARGWGWSVALGVVNILLGIWIWTGIPMSGLVIGFFVGLQLLFVGILWIMLGFSGREARPATA
jgi:uncharacterized membrane protein HdeD (DUF308 family)